MQDDDVLVNLTVATTLHPSSYHNVKVEQKKISMRSFRRLPLTMTAKSKPSRGPPPLATPHKDKGKQRADSQSPKYGPPVDDLLEEAMSTPMSVSSSVDSHFEHEPFLTPPPKALHLPLRRQPRLLSDLVRTTLPASSIAYEGVGVRHGRTIAQDLHQNGESSNGHRHDSRLSRVAEPYPDLDPATALPVGRQYGALSRAPSLHLQRTITDLLSSSQQIRSSSSYLPNLPSFSSVSLPSFGRTSTESVRPFSSSASQDDWASWANSWWSGNKGKVDRMMTQDDQAETVEEEKEKHRRKCGLTSLRRPTSANGQTEHRRILSSSVMGC